jgi:hypothetical protein
VIVDVDLQKLDAQLSRIKVSRVEFEAMMGFPVIARMESGNKLRMWHAIQAATVAMDKFRGWFPDATVTAIRFMDE